MRTAWHECNLADLLTTTWPLALGVSRLPDGRIATYPCAWRLWLSMPSKPKAPPIVVCRELTDVSHAGRCAAFTSLEFALVLVAADEGALLDADLSLLCRDRLASMGEGRSKPLRWLDVCALAGVDPWARASKAHRSLGRVLSLLGLEAVRVEVLGADERTEARAL